MAEETILRAVPDGRFSYDFTVFDGGGTPVARALLSKWDCHEITKVRIGAMSYEAYRREQGGDEYEDLDEYDFKNEDGRVVAMADYKLNSLRKRWVLQHGDDRYELKKESVRRSTLR